MPYYDNIFYINMAQDESPAQADRLLIHGEQVILVKIPDIEELANYKTLELQNVTAKSKVYLAAHGTNQDEENIFNQRNADMKFYSYQEVANFLVANLDVDLFKNEQHPLFLVLSVCEGLDFARNLQQELFKTHGIFCQIVANKYITHELFENNKKDKTVNIVTRTTSLTPDKNSSREHHRPHSKVLLTINQKGIQKEIDAYELKWLLTVIDTLKNDLFKYLKWLDVAQETSLATWNKINQLFQQVLAVITQNSGQDLNKMTNQVFAILNEAINPEKNTVFFQPKEAPILYAIKNLIEQGQTFINFSPEMKAEQLIRQEMEGKLEPSEYMECLLRIKRALKAKYSSILREEAENPQPNIQYIQEEQQNLQNNQNKINKEQVAAFKLLNNK